MPRQITITISDDDFEVLENELSNVDPEWRRVTDVEGLVEASIETLVAGFQRPGAWEAEAARQIASMWRGRK